MKPQPQLDMAKLLALVPPDTKTACVGCRAPVPMKTTLPCICGGFVCPSCAAQEAPDTCQHYDRPATSPAISNTDVAALIGGEA